MATMSDIVGRALRKLRVVAIDEPMTADELADGLQQLNSLMHGLKAWGADLSYSDLAASDAFPLGPEFEEGMVYMLAGRLSPDYNAPAGSGREFKRLIQAAYMVIPAVTIDTAIRYTPSQRYDNAET